MNSSVEAHFVYKCKLCKKHNHIGEFYVFWLPLYYCGEVSKGIWKQNYLDFWRVSGISIIYNENELVIVQIQLKKHNHIIEVVVLLVLH